jgi:hypothetical protein
MLLFSVLTAQAGLGVSHFISTLRCINPARQIKQHLLV